MIARLDAWAHRRGILRRVSLGFGTWEAYEIKISAWYGVPRWLVHRAARLGLVQSWPTKHHLARYVDTRRRGRRWVVVYDLSAIRSSS